MIGWLNALSVGGCGITHFETQLDPLHLERMLNIFINHACRILLNLHYIPLYRVTSLPLNDCFCSNQRCSWQKVQSRICVVKSESAIVQSQWNLCNTWHNLSRKEPELVQEFSVQNLGLYSLHGNHLSLKFETYEMDGWLCFNADS